MVVGVPWNHGKHDLEPDGEVEPREIEDAKMQDNECLDVDIGESDTERNGGSRSRTVQRTKMRTTSVAAREHSHL